MDRDQGLSLRTRIAAGLSRHPRVRLSLLLAAPLTWLVLVYVVAMLMLLVTALLPMLALILTRKLRPMIIGSLSG